MVQSSVLTTAFRLVLVALVFSGTTGASQVALGLAAEVVQLDTNSVAVAPATPKPFDVKGALATAVAAAKALESAAKEATELAHTPGQKAEAKRLTLQAESVSSEVAAKERQVDPGAAPKSFGQVEQKSEEKAQEAEKLAQVQQFQKAVKKEQQEQAVRRDTIEREEKAAKATKPPSPPPITQADIDAAVLKQKEADKEVLLQAKVQFRAQLARQKANLTAAAEHTLSLVKEKAEKDVATIRSEAEFAKKHADLQREQDSLLHQKQVTTNALLKARLAAQAEQSHIEAAASQQAAAVVAQAAQDVASQYPSSATEQAATASQTKVLTASARTLKLSKMASHAKADAALAKKNARQAEEKENLVTELAAQARAANASVEAAATKLASTAEKAAEVKVELSAHQRAISRGVADYQKAQNEMAKVNTREAKAKTDIKSAFDRQLQAEHTEKTSSDTKSKRHAKEIQFKAGGDARVAAMEKANAEMEKEKAEADANYQKIALEKMRIKAEDSKARSIEINQKKTAAAEAHKKSVAKARVAEADKEKAQAQLVTLHKAEAKREVASKAELKKAAVEAVQDVHESTAKASARAKTFALFKLEQTKLKGTEVAELSAKVDHAKQAATKLATKPALNSTVLRDSNSELDRAVPATTHPGPPNTHKEGSVDRMLDETRAALASVRHP